MGRRRNPYPGLVLLALVPALALGGCWRLADGKVPPPLPLPSTAALPVAEPEIGRAHV